MAVGLRDTLSSSPFGKRSDPANQLSKLLSTAAAGASDVWVGIVIPHLHNDSDRESYPDLPPSCSLPFTRLASEIRLRSGAV